MKRSQIFLISLYNICCFSQTAPSIAWQKLIGGSGEESSYFTFNYNNGNLYLTSSSNSNISGDKTETNRGIYNDYWLVKTNDNGSILWNKTMGAGPIVALGPDNDIITSVHETLDGNVLVGGFSNSNISGEKTEVSRGDYDYWLLKLDPNGTILWDKTFGGDGVDYPSTFFECNDGNYIIAGSSNSSNTGDKTDISRGAADLWILKVDTSGTVLWQKTIGGSGNESLSKMMKTIDDGFILVSTSSSPLSGEKAENSYGVSDYWVVKLDNNGNIQWQKTIGGSNVDSASNIIETVDGGYLVSGKSNSSISGLKTENSRGDYDYWFVKIDSNGIIEWQKTIGGSGYDNLNNVYQCLDNGFIAVGTTLSNISGDKTEDTKGDYDGWIVKLDENGVLQWQKDIGGIGNDSFTWIKQMPDASFILGGGSTSSNSFDITTTNHSLGHFDIWLLKLNAEGLGTTTFEDLQVVLYPNPTKEMVTIDFGSTLEDVTVSVTTLLGQTMSKHTFSSLSTVQLPIIGATGAYFVTVTTLAGARKVFKVLKE